MDRLTARRYIIVRRSDSSVGSGGPGSGKRRKPSAERRGEKSNRGWIYGDRVQPVVFLSAAIHHLYQVRGLTFDQVAI